MCDSPERLVLKLQLDTVERKELLVLLEERIFRFFNNSYERLLVEIFKRNYNGKPADELGDNAVFYYVVRYNVLVDTARNLLLRRLFLGVKAYLLAALTLFNDGFNTVESAAADKENVLRVYLNAKP